MATNNWRLSYAGVNLPPPLQGGIVITLQPIDEAERNAEGDMMMEHVAKKYTVAINWGRLSGDEANLITSTLEANRTGDLEYFDVAKGDFVTRKVYYGAGVSVSFIQYDDDLKKQKYHTLNVNFIEM